MKTAAAYVVSLLLLFGFWAGLAFFLRGCRTPIVNDGETHPDGLSEAWMRNRRRREARS